MMACDKLGKGILALLAMTFVQCGLGSGALAQTRAQCEAGIAAVKGQLAQGPDAGRRAELERALRKAEREGREQEYDECQEALEDAGIGGAEASPYAEPDERVGADSGLPVTVEDAFVPSPGEAEVTVGFGYNRAKHGSGGLGILGGDDDDDDDDDDESAGDDDDGGRHFGRHLFTPRMEVEYGLAPGLAASFEASYGLGNAEEAKQGEAELGLKWNVLPMRGLGPALSLGGSVEVPYGYDSGDAVETTLALYASQPLGSGEYAPFLHGNLSWTHSFNRDEAEERANRVSGVLGIALPVAESTALVADFVREQDEEKGENSSFLELGLRQMLPGEILLGAGVGAGLGNSNTGFRALVGVQKAF